MFKLSFKFKKILRWFNKILRLILMFGCIASLFVISSFASSFTARNLKSIVGSNPTGTLSFSEDPFLVSITPELLADGRYRFAIPSNYRDLRKVSLDLNGQSLGGLELIPGDIISLSGTLAIRQYTADANFQDSVVRSGSCSFVWGNDQFFAGALNTVSNGHIEDFMDSRYIFFDFDFIYEVPAGYSQYTNNRFNITFDFGDVIDSNFNGFYVASPDIQLYVGDRDNAPIYSGSSNAANDAYKEAEDQVIEDTQGSIDEAKNVINSFYESLNPENSIGSGLLFVSGVFRSLMASNPWILLILTFSLALGTLLIILGVIDMIKKRG